MSEKIRPTASWMRVWYDKMNKEVFGGALGDCELGVFTSGKGSNGNTLGWFKMLGRPKCDRYTRKIFVKDFWGDREYINRSNFVAKCKPKIEINGNYTATEEALLNTLVHEMCHYYTYMNGIAPKQGHGPEFRRACALVESSSNGRFIISRLANAEEMQNWELDADIKRKNDEREERKKKKSIIYLIVTPKDSFIRFGITTQQTTVDEISFSEKNCDFLGTCNDIDLLEFLNKNGYCSVSRTYRFWRATDKKVKEELLKHKWQYVWGSSKTPQKALGIEDRIEPQQKPIEEYHLGYRIVKDGDGYNLEGTNKKKTFGSPIKEIYFDENKNLFVFTMGKFKYEGTPGHWQKINESKRSIDTIITETINRMINEIVADNEQDDSNSIEITPNMNLGLASPYEYEGM